MKFLKFTLLLTILVLGSLSSWAQIDTVNTTRLDYSAKPKEYIIGKLEAKGLKLLNPELLIATTGLVVGDSIIIPSEQLSITARRLWDQRHFSDVKIETDFPSGDTVNITFLLKERQRVTKWMYDGIKVSEAKDLNAKLKVRRNSELTDFQLKTSLKLIRDYYNEKAFRNAKISYRTEQDSVTAGNVIIVFEINRGKKVRIGEISFEDNNNLPAKKLAKSLKKTRKASINVFQSSKFKDADFEEDRDNLVNYYKSKGYRDAKILADSLYPINDKRIGLWIKVDEGKKYYYRDISWIGNSLHPTKMLQDMLQINKGDVYDSESMGKRLGVSGKTDPMSDISVASLYVDQGYLSSVIEPVETVIGDSVDVQIRIIEGNQFRIKDVKFEGNTRTNDHVIRRELYTRPGELYSQSLLMRSYQRLAQMGQFDPTSIRPDIVPNYQQELVDIKYSLTEISNDQLELSGGWGGGMFIASVGVNFTNVALRNFFDKNAWRPYPAGDAQTIGIKIQSNGTYYQAASLSFIEPWLGGRKPTSLSVSFYTSRESNAIFIGAVANKFFGTTGGAISLGKRLNWPDPYFTLSMGISLQSYKLQDWDYFVVRNGVSNTIAANFTLGRNSVDDPYQYPSQGSDISLSLAITPPFSAFDKQDYSNKNMSENDRYRWIEYHKWKFDAKWFFPLTSNNKLVLMARAQFGYLGYYNTNKRSPFEGFTMGGDGLTGYSVYGVETIGLRGYENSSLTPYANYGQHASIYSKYIAEIRYPVIRQGQTMVYALGFLEAGNAFAKLDEYKPYNLKRSAGVGLRIFLPILGMLGIDWGYGFDQTSQSQGKPSGSQFHFSLGMQM